jgi:Xaa-Pro aminopeptidase
MSSRLNRLLEKLKFGSLDGVLISNSANVSYLSYYNIPDSYLLVSLKKAYFITDFRYVLEAEKNIRGVPVFKYNNLFKDTARLAKKLKIRRLGFEAKDLNVAEYAKIKEYAGPKIKLVDTFNLIESLRQIKEPREVKYIKEAIGITASALKFLKHYLKPGLSELEIAGELERFIRYRGAPRSAFNIIVASGPHSSFPHAPISSRRLKPDDSVLIDIGVEVKGYKSDLTRVFFLDRIQPIQRKLYQIIIAAQEKAIGAVKPESEISKLDYISRSYIRSFGYGRYFGHSLGHGVGLEVHEEPHISAKNKSLVKEGMVFTIEPGIYLPGRFGLRVEDMVLVTKKGVEVLSGAIDKSI